MWNLMICNVRAYLRDGYGTVTIDDVTEINRDGGFFIFGKKDGEKLLVSEKEIVTLKYNPSNFIKTYVKKRVNNVEVL